MQTYPIWRICIHKTRYILYRFSKSTFAWNTCVCRWPQRFVRWLRRLRALIWALVLLGFTFGYIKEEKKINTPSNNIILLCYSSCALQTKQVSRFSSLASSLQYTKRCVYKKKDTLGARSFSTHRQSQVVGLDFRHVLKGISIYTDNPHIIQHNSEAHIEALGWCHTICGFAFVSRETRTTLKTRETPRPITSILPQSKGLCLLRVEKSLRHTHTHKRTHIVYDV